LLTTLPSETWRSLKKPNGGGGEEANVYPERRLTEKERRQKPPEKLTIRQKKGQSRKMGFVVNLQGGFFLNGRGSRRREKECDRGVGMLTDTWVREDKEILTKKIDFQIQDSQRGGGFVGGD